MYDQTLVTNAQTTLSITTAGATIDVDLYSPHGLELVAGLWLKLMKCSCKASKPAMWYPTRRDILRAPGMGDSSAGVRVMAAVADSKYRGIVPDRAQEDESGIQR